MCLFFQSRQTASIILYWGKWVKAHHASYLRSFQETPGVVEPHCNKLTLADPQLLDCQDTLPQSHQLGCWKVAEGVCSLQGICTHRLQPLCNRSPLSSTKCLSLHDREHNRSSCTCREGLPNIKHASFLFFHNPVWYVLVWYHESLTWIILWLPKPLKIHCLELTNFYTLKSNAFRLNYAIYRIRYCKTLSDLDMEW